MLSVDETAERCHYSTQYKFLFVETGVKNKTGTKEKKNHAVRTMTWSAHR